MRDNFQKISDKKGAQSAKKYTFYLSGVYICYFIKNLARFLLSNCSG